MQVTEEPSSSDVSGHDDKDGNHGLPLSPTAAGLGGVQLTLQSAVADAFPTEYTGSPLAAAEEGVTGPSPSPAALNLTAQGLAALGGATLTREDESTNLLLRRHMQSVKGELVSAAGSQWEVHGELGKGAFGVVYRVSQLSLPGDAHGVWEASRECIDVILRNFPRFTDHAHYNAVHDREWMTLHALMAPSSPSGAHHLDDAAAALMPPPPPALMPHPSHCFSDCAGHGFC